MNDHLPFSRDGTSHEAAHSMEEPAPAIREQVFRFIARLSQGATCDEIELCQELSHQTASARVNELYRAGRIVDSSQRRKTRSGRAAIVWIVAESQLALI